MEIEILQALQGLHNPVLDGLMVAVTRLGDAGLVWIGLALVLLLRKQSRWCGIAMALALLIGMLCTNIVLKPLVLRPRPFAAWPELMLLVPAPTDPSFPSGHTTAAFAATFSLVFQGKRWWWVALILAGLIAFSRLYLFVHYPTDVLAGAAIGLLAGWCGSRLAKKLQTWWENRRPEE